jgi:hypothetical protein
MTTHEMAFVCKDLITKFCDPFTIIVIEKWQKLSQNTSIKYKTDQKPIRYLIML